VRVCRHCPRVHECHQPAAGCHHTLPPREQQLWVTGVQLRHLKVPSSVSRIDARPARAQRRASGRTRHCVRCTSWICRHCYDLQHPTGRYGSNLCSCRVPVSTPQCLPSAPVALAQRSSLGTTDSSCCTSVPPVPQLCGSHGTSASRWHHHLRWTLVGTSASFWYVVAAVIGAPTDRSEALTGAILRRQATRKAWCKGEPKGTCPLSPEVGAASVTSVHHFVLQPTQRGDASVAGVDTNLTLDLLAWCPAATFFCSIVEDVVAKMNHRI
jgi:hypothetical protein